ncbi:MAG: hypothetical protein IPK82_41495 [Polyangiaceae bacterium]|nr:hypothetical protein [Polyangiaceae bacterium]
MLTRTRQILAITLALSAFGQWGCKEDEGPVAPPRAVLRGENGQYSFVPTLGQLPYCLIVEVKDGYARSLTISDDGQSVECESGVPIAKKTWPIPQKDDLYRAYVVFSDRKLRGDTTATQIQDRLKEAPSGPVTPMDLRAPGQVFLERIDIRPAELRPPK